MTAYTGRAITIAAAPTSTDKNWQRHGVCASSPDPDLWFATGTTRAALLQIEEAKAACRACPVLLRCRNWALDTREAHGVWGGLSEDERTTVIRRRVRSKPVSWKAVHELAEKHGEDIRRMMLVERKTTAEIAEVLGCEPAVVVSAVRRMKILPSFALNPAVAGLLEREEQLRTFRDKYNLTNAQIAARMGSNQTAVSDAFRVLMRRDDTAAAEPLLLEAVAA